MRVIAPLALALALFAAPRVAEGMSAGEAGVEELSARSTGNAALAALAVLQDPTRRDTTRRDSTARRPDPATDTSRVRRPAADSAAADSLDERRSPFGAIEALDSLDLRLTSRLEAKGERVKNDRCNATPLFATAFTCGGSFQPSFDFQFNLLTKGTVANRVHVDVDYDTQREFDASNNISIRYEGRGNEPLQRLEVGNVFFSPPTSRFLTAGIPSGNYGVQAVGKLGAMSFAAILAQQKGNIIPEQVFVMGDRTVQTLDRDIEDYQIEPRRFFFTVDPVLFGAAYPNIDILNRAQMTALGAALPDSLRPSKVYIYRHLLGGQPRNPNGPQFRIIGDPTSQRGQVYELLRERIDYYLDPSLLWFALVAPLNLNNERLVVAYTVRIGGRDVTIASTGGTPDLEFVPERDQWANLVWDPRLTPDDPAFRREIRSVYRLGGDEVRRQSVQVKIVTGASADQEKPPAGNADTYLQLFGLAEATNSSRFDADNRLWPRPNDANVIVAEGGGDQRIVRDYFIVFPSLEPFARRGLAGPIANPANDTIYRTPGEYLYSAQHPQSFYRIRARYESQVSEDPGTLALNAVQLRAGSERIVVDGRQLVRGLDYTIDYEIGQITFARPDTLFAVPRQVRVRYEENPLFASIPTSIWGVTTGFAGEQGTLNFTAISQTQRTTFTRPPLGYEPASTLVAGVNGDFAFDAAPLGRAVAKALPFTDSIAGPTRIELDGEFAVSRPRANRAGQAYVESFEGEGGIQVQLTELAWYYGSQPALGERFPARFGATTLDLDRATTLAWQSNGTDRLGRSVQYRIEQIDPLTNIVGTGFSAPEPMLWLTLYPLRIGGLRNAATNSYRWQVGDTPSGRRWRSIRTSLGPSGADLSRVETIEFWSLIDAGQLGAATNPILIIDLGDVSENSVTFAPESAFVSLPPGGAPGIDTTYTGRKLQGFDRLDSERDPFSRAFNVDVNDLGLPGDVVDTLIVLSGGTARADTGVRICVRGDVRLRAIGDSRSNCTVRNNRLDEEDLDSDNVLNLPSARRGDERIRRYIVDMSDRRSFNRVGECHPRPDLVNSGLPAGSNLCWVHFRVPFNAPDDSLNGGPPIRRVQSMRITMLSPNAANDDAFVTVPIARLRLVGAPWLKRDDRPLQGIAGERAEQGNGYVIAGVIGTQDRDSTRGLVYEPPPGVTDQADDLQTPFDPARVQINERSLRLQAGGVPKYGRAEAYYRFPEGQKNFMTYRELRVWARGRGNGWGPTGELQFFIKIGRDPNNFYLYRAPAFSGNSRLAWEPEIRVRFERFFALRSRLQNAYLQQSADSISCTGVDSAIIARSGLPLGAAVNRYAACDGGYMVYTTDPAVTPPNLAAVQELAVGILRVDSAVGPNPIMASDTLEVWVDDIRLADVVNETGFAARIGLGLTLGDVGSFRIAATRRDPNFRQLTETPTFLESNDLEIGATFRVDKLLPPSFGVALPLSIVHTTAATDPLFLSRSDIAGDEIAGLRTPKASITTYALSARRSEPLVGPWYAPIVNHLGLTATYVAAGNRSEFQNGRGRNFNVGLDFFVTAPVVGSDGDEGGLGTRDWGLGGAVIPSGAAGDGPMSFRAEGARSAPGVEESPSSRQRGWTSRFLPTWLSFSGYQAGALNLRPTIFRVTSGLTRNTDRRASYLKPALAVDDSGLVATGESHLWRNTTALELKPAPDVTARADVVQLRDLRDYDAETPNAIAARAERGSLLGLDVGMERERQILGSITYAPQLNPWLRPRLDLATSSTFLRDPNARSLIDDPGDGEAPALPVRAGNNRAITVGATLDLARATTAPGGGRSSLLRRTLGLLQPIDVSINRGVLSSYDGAGTIPGLGYQLGLGTIDNFRRLDGEIANSAGASTQFALSAGLNLPFDVAISNRFQRTLTNNWSRRALAGETRVDGDQIVAPDISARWSPRGPLFGGLIASAGINARMLHTRQSLEIPSVLSNIPNEERAIRIRSYPVNATFTWGPGDFTTSAGYTYSTRLDSLPGSVASGLSSDINAEVARTFDLPDDWGLRSGLRARLGYQQTRNESYVENVFATERRSRLTDNGRQAFSLNADTDVAENLTFSLQASRVVTFDRNFNRRFTQNVVTAVLQMQFFSGDLR